MKKTFLSIIVFISILFIINLINDSTTKSFAYQTPDQHETIASGTEGSESQHQDPVIPILIHLSIILIAAKIGAEIFELLKQPSVLGELIFGMILGNLGLIFPDYHLFDALRMEHLTENYAIVIDIFARIGIILLLFEVGLESTVADMRKVGISSTIVAFLGVIAPFILGFFVSYFFIKQVPEAILKISPNFNLINIHVFIGAILCATSVGITARVFQDLNKIQTKEARIIIGAAVIDDVLGLIILAIVSSLVISAETGEGINILGLGKITLIAVVFLVGSIFIGITLMPKVMNLFARMKTHGIMLISALLFCFLLSILANSAGLATIVGAYAAGLILEDIHFKEFKEDMQLHQLLKPITTIFVPIFFIQMGVQVHLETFGDINVLGIAAGLTIAAVIGKQICGLGIHEKGVSRLTIGLGMIPRGEVGLIFASIGKGLNVIDDGIFSAVVIMVIITTVITPPLLKISMKKIK
jgi:Kef-type K+ transport system membrane component KefB